MTIAARSYQQPMLAGASAWLVSEAKTGLEVQMRGVADRLGLDPVLKTVNPRGIWKAGASLGLLDPSERFGQARSPFVSPWPAVAIGAGVASLPYLRALKRSAGVETFTIALQKAPSKFADLICVPEHDRPAGAINVVTMLAPPHGFSQPRLVALRAEVPPDIASLPSPRVAILIGGPNAVYAYADIDRQRLAWAVGSIASLAGSVMITVSRRTPPALAAAVDGATAGKPRLFWTGDGDNPYPAMLAHSNVTLVTADSINMTGEALATGNPVYVFEPAGGSAKFRRFHQALMERGFTRSCPSHFDAIEHWAYTPLDSAAMIAAEVERRWARRSRMLSGMIRQDGVTARCGRRQ